MKKVLEKLFKDFAREWPEIYKEFLNCYGDVGLRCRLKAAEYCLCFIRDRIAASRRDSAMRKWIVAGMLTILQAIEDEPEGVSPLVPRLMTVALDSMADDERFPSSRGAHSADVSQDHEEERT